MTFGGVVVVGIRGFVGGLDVAYVGIAVVVVVLYLFFV